MQTSAAQDAITAPRVSSEESVERTTVTGLEFPRYFTRPGVDPFDEVDWELRSAVIGNEKGHGRRRFAGAAGPPERPFGGRRRFVDGGRLPAFADRRTPPGPLQAPRRRAHLRLSAGRRHAPGGLDCRVADEAARAV